MKMEVHKPKALHHKYEGTSKPHAKRCSYTKDKETK